MTSKTFLDDLKPLYFGWFGAQHVPQEGGFHLVPVATRVCWYKPSKVPT